MKVFKSFIRALVLLLAALAVVYAFGVTFVATPYVTWLSIAEKIPLLAASLVLAVVACLVQRQDSRVYITVSGFFRD